MSVVSDDFNRSNRNLNGDTADSGQTWSGLAGTPQIVSNQGAGAASGNDIATIDAGIADCEVYMTVTTKNGDEGVIGRASNVSNLFLAQATATAINLLRRTSGSYTSLGTHATAIANNDVLKLKMNGSSLEVLLNGVSKVTATDTQNQTNTRHGFRLDGSTTSRIDTFRVDALATGGQPYAARVQGIPGMGRTVPRIGRGW